MRLLESFPALLVDDEAGDPTYGGKLTRDLLARIRAQGIPVICATGVEDARQVVTSTRELSAVLIDWDVHHLAVPTTPGGRVSLTQNRLTLLAREIRELFPQLPILILSDKARFDEVPQELLSCCSGYLAKLDDTPEFVVGRIHQAREDYLDTLLPPFFKELVAFTEESHYSWHTPGHSGGTGFLKTPVGTALHRFFGENTLRSDLSVSVAELGSLLEHSGPVGAAEREAARAFGADRTMFVTNGTSTANKIVFHACVGDGDVVLVDRNCHKSIMHAIVMTGAIPVYLQPVRNELGVIGPIPRARFDADHIRQTMADNPLVPEGVERARLAVITNSTYDGLCYDAGQIVRDLAAVVDVVLFDEAWFAYAHFHPLYAGRHAMGIGTDAPAARITTSAASQPPAVFATQSTHKLLTAFSQGSMVHLHDPAGRVSEVALEEAFMMHTSTSPQYGIIASLDVAARSMTGDQGTALVDATIEEAVRFRSDVRRLGPRRGDEDGEWVDDDDDDVPEYGLASVDDWFFDVWQPPHSIDGCGHETRDPQRWLVADGESWHGYPPTRAQVMLDPMKVTITTPGVAANGLEQQGVPAAVLSRFLDERGIVVEKTGSYSVLVLFSLGVTEGRSGTLIAELLEFKRLYDRGAPLLEVLPRLVREHEEEYSKLTLRQLCDAVHAAVREVDLPSITAAVYEGHPLPVMRPKKAFNALVAAQVEMVDIDAVAGRTSAAMVVPYPPGIPVIMPGERYGDAASSLIEYLHVTERLARRFPGFETEIHGVEIADDGSYRLPVLT